VIVHGCQNHVGAGRLRVIGTAYGIINFQSRKVSPFGMWVLLVDHRSFYDDGRPAITVLSGSTNGEEFIHESGYAS
jgi:hypothetical protein